MSSTIPQSMKVLVVQEGKKVKVEEVPVPTLASNEVLVKVHSIAQNPTDWKHVDFVSPLGNIIGCDFSGTVVKLGSDIITRVKVGDTVAGFEHGGNYKDRGAFAQYVKADSELVWKFSTDAVSFDEAAAMGCALWTSIQAFYHRMGLAEPPSKSDKGEWVPVYAGSSEWCLNCTRRCQLICARLSSSLGLFSTQLLKLSGYKVVTTVSPKNSDLLKSLGADVIIDYKSPDAVEHIQKATGNSLRLAFDTISDATTQAVCVKSLDPTAPGKIIFIQKPNEDAKALRADVQIQHTLLYTALGQAFRYPSGDFPASPEDRQHMTFWMPKLEELVNSKKIKPNPVKLWPGGLEAVHEGFQYMREGKVSAEKIVYHVE